MDIKQSKSILAKLLATEDISVQHKNIPTAYFDLKNRVLALPTWKEMSTDLYDLLTGHEVGHALFTPESGWHDAITDSTEPSTFKGFLNVLEDARIEKLIKRKFPGLAKNFYTAYKELFDQNFFEVEHADIPDLLLIDRINIHFKMGAFYAVPFSPAEQEIVREVEKLETWDQVHALAKKLFGMAEDELKDKQIQAKLFMPGSAEGDDDDGEGLELELTQEEFDEIAKKYKQLTTPESITDRAFRNREKELLDEKAKPHYYFNLGEFDSSKFVWNYKDIMNMLDFSPKQESHRTSLFQEFRNRNNKFIGYLIKEFELRRNAQQLARARVTKSGEIDMKKLHQFNFSEDLFLKVTAVPKGKNHGLIMYYDMSGSMSHYMGAVIEQMLILVEFCRKVNIPFEVYGFTNNFSRFKGREWDDAFRHRVGSMQENDIGLGDPWFRLQQYFTDQMSAAEYKKQISNLLLIKKCWESYYDRSARNNFESSMPVCEQLHSTPLNQTIILSRDIFNRFKQRTKAEIVNMVYLTDGEADNSLKYHDGNGLDHVPGSSHATIYIKDKQSRIEAKVPEGSNNKGYTTALLELVRGRTGANIVGFYLSNSPKRAVEYNIIGDRWNRSITAAQEAEVERIMAGYKKDKVAIVTKAGFNEYYVVHADSLDINDDAEIAGESIQDIRRNFRKLHKGKLVNRVLLNRFIAMIA